ncbi:zinc finger, CCHC-type containing protein, partial [Tanacetum coccineum]
SKDAMFDEKRFTSIPRPKSLMPSSNEDQIGEIPIENHTARRSNKAREAKSFGYDFQLYLFEGSRDEIGPRYSYCYSIKEDPRTLDEAMKSRDVAFLKETINDELLIALAATYNLVIHQMDVKTTFLNGDLEEKAYMKQPEGNEHTDIGEVDVILCIRIKRENKVNTPLDPTIKLMPNTGRVVDQLEYSRAIGCLMYAMISTRPYISYVVGKLSRCYFMASKKQTCITDSTMEAEFVVLAAAGKEA